MKILIPNYSFNKTAKTVTFTDYVSITLENVLLITNVTDGITIYQFNEPSLGGTVASNVLTLEYDTTSMSDTDDLQIWYDDPNATQTVSATNLDIRDLSQASDGIAIYGSDDGGTTKRIVKTDAGGAIQVDLEVANVTVTSSALPTGASSLTEQQAQTTHLASIAGEDFATSAKQDTIIGHIDGVETLIGTTNTTLGTIDTDTGNIATSVASIDAKTPALGQALAAASVPVVLTAAQLSTLTPPAAITGFATETTLAALNTKVTAVNTGAVVVSSSALPSGAATAANQSSELILIGAVNETAPASDTASSGLNGRLQRIAQRITSLIALVPTALTAGGNFKVAIQEALVAGTAYIGKTRLTDGTTDAEVVPLTGYNAQAVAIVDGSGNQITSFGGSSTRSTPASATYTSAQTNTTFLTPTSGKKIVVTGRQCMLDGGTSVKVSARMAFGSPVSTSVLLLGHEGLVPGSVYAPPMDNPVAGAVNQSIYVTTTAATDGNVTFIVDYYEE